MLFMTSSADAKIIMHIQVLNSLRSKTKIHIHKDTFCQIYQDVIHMVLFRGCTCTGWISVKFNLILEGTKRDSEETELIVDPHLQVIKY